MCLQGGYKTQTVAQLGNLLSTFNCGAVSFRALRIYFAALAAVAAREAAERSRERDSRKPVSVQYLACELGRLAGCPVAGVRRELRELERAGLLLFSESAIVFTRAALPTGQSMIANLAGGRSQSRPIPLPRPLLRFIARCPRVATIKTMLAYCVRGLSLSRDGEISGRGTAKASWIAETWGISLRAVRLARAELIALGFISRDGGSTQWKLNRHGSYFSLNMTFSGEPVEVASAPRCVAPRLRSARPAVETCPPFAPPYKYKKTPYGLKNQKTLLSDNSGSWKKTDRNEPKLSDIQVGDLRSVSRMTLLHGQAVSSGLARKGEAGRIEFLAAAVHAIAVGRRNPAGLFATIVRKGLWKFITQADEDRASRALDRMSSRGRQGARVVRPRNGEGKGGICKPEAKSPPTLQHLSSILTGVQAGMLVR